MAGLPLRRVMSAAHLDDVDPVQRVAQHQKDVPLRVNGLPRRRDAILHSETGFAQHTAALITMLDGSVAVSRE